MTFESQNLVILVTLQGGDGNRVPTPPGTSWKLKRQRKVINKLLINKTNLELLMSAFQILQSTVYVLGQELFSVLTSLPWVLFSVYFIDTKFGFSVRVINEPDLGLCCRVFLDYHTTTMMYSKYEANGAVAAHTYKGHFSNSAYISFWTW